MKEFFTIYNPFLILGLIWFFFFGLLAEKIFNNRWIFARNFNGKLTLSIPYIIFSIVFNGAGALVGWFALYIIWGVPENEFSFQHIFLLLVVFAGVTGNLPRIIFYGLWGK